MSENKTLWSDNKTEDTCDGYAKDNCLYNLFEDIRVLKEQLLAAQNVVDVVYSTKDEVRILLARNSDTVFNHKNVVDETILLEEALKKYEELK